MRANTRNVVAQPRGMSTRICASRQRRNAQRNEERDSRARRYHQVCRLFAALSPVVRERAVDIAGERNAGVVG